jgi:hypothetical protein
MPFHDLRIVVILLAIIALMFLLMHYSAEAQTIDLSPEHQCAGNGQTLQQESESEQPRAPDLTMKVQLKPYKDELLEGLYQVSDFVIAVSYTSELCPTGNCSFELEGGQVEVITPGEAALTGKLNVDSGDLTKIMNLFALWQTVEERKQDGGTTQIIEGTLDAGNDPANPDYQSQINGTLISEGNNLILGIRGTAGSPYAY